MSSLILNSYGDYFIQLVGPKTVLDEIQTLNQTFDRISFMYFYIFFIMIKRIEIETDLKKQ